MTGFTEIHTHVVFGVDDGAQTEADMYALLDAAHKEGVSTLFATSHVTPGIRPFDFEKYKQHLELARRYCRDKGYALELCAGAEILSTPALERYVWEESLPTLGNSNRVLVEFAVKVEFQQIVESVRMLERGGYVPILAHIERYACLQHSKNAWKLKELCDVGYQVNARTVVEGRGFFQDRCVHKWFDAGLIDWVASDAHDCVRRPFMTQKAYNVLRERYGSAYAGRLLGLQRTI